jgi:hypothetical protein
MSKTAKISDKVHKILKMAALKSDMKITEYLEKAIIEKSERDENNNDRLNHG